MLTIKPKAGKKDFFNLPVYKSEKIASATNNEGQKYSIYAGLDRKLSEQLKTCSLNKKDTELQKTTRDYKRFGIGNYEEWYKGGKIIFALVAEPENKLAAIIWYGPKAYPTVESHAMSGKDTHTAAYRSYAPFRGSHLMTDFAHFVQNLYLAQHPGAVLWIETGSKTGVGLFHHLGFRETGEVSILGKTVMVYQRAGYGN